MRRADSEPRLRKASVPGPKAASVTAQGEDDGFVPAAGWMAEATPDGDTRLVAQVAVADLPRVHAALVRALEPPLGFLYRQKVDRRNPRAQGAPPRDLVTLERAPDALLGALERAAVLVYGDARCEVWIRGRRGEQLVLDEDGMLYAYPDDPTFRDALVAEGVPAADVELLSRRDYVKHWFRAEADALEDALVRELGLTEVRPQR